MKKAYACIINRTTNQEYCVALWCKSYEGRKIRVSRDAYNEGCERDKILDGVEACAISGLRMAWLPMGYPCVEIRITHVSGHYEPGQYHGIAYATMYAFAYCMGNQDLADEKFPDGWDVVDCGFQ